MSFAQFALDPKKLSLNVFTEAKMPADGYAAFLANRRRVHHRENYSGKI